MVFRVLVKPAAHVVIGCNLLQIRFDLLADFQAILLTGLAAVGETTALW